MAAVNETRNLQSSKSFHFARSRRASSVALPLSRGEENLLKENESNVAETKEKVSTVCKDEVVYIKALFAALHTALPDTVRVDLLESSLQELCFLVALSPRLCSFSERRRHSLRHPALALAAKRLYWLREAQKELQNMQENDVDTAGEELVEKEQSAKKYTRKQEVSEEQRGKQGEPLTLHQIEKSKVNNYVDSDNSSDGWKEYLSYFITVALGCDNGWSDFYLSFSDALRSYRHFFTNDKEIEDCIVSDVEYDNAGARPKSSERLQKAKGLSWSKLAQQVRSFHAPFAHFKNAQGMLKNGDNTKVDDTHGGNNTGKKNNEVQHVHTSNGNEPQGEHRASKDVLTSDYNTCKKSQNQYEQSKTPNQMEHNWESGNVLMNKENSIHINNNNNDNSNDISHQNEMINYSANNRNIKSKTISTVSSIVEQNNINIFLTRTNYKIYSRAKECLLAPAMRRSLQLCSVPRLSNYQNSYKTNMYNNYRKINNNSHSPSTDRINEVKTNRDNHSYVGRGEERWDKHNGYAQRKKIDSNSYNTYVDDEAEATMKLLEYQDYEEERWEHIGNCYNAMLEEVHRLREYFVQNITQNAMLNDIIRRFWIRLTVSPTECKESTNNKMESKLPKNVFDPNERGSAIVKNSEADAHVIDDRHKRNSKGGDTSNITVKNASNNNNKRTTTNTRTKLNSSSSSSSKKQIRKLGAKALENKERSTTQNSFTSAEPNTFITEVSNVSRKTKYTTAVDKNKRKGKSNDNVVNKNAVATLEKQSQNASMYNQMHAVSFSFSPGVQASAKLSKKEHIRQMNAAQVFMSPMQYIYLNLRIAEILLPRSQSNHSNELQMEMLTSIREDLLIDASYVSDTNTPHSSQSSRSQRILHSPRTRRRQELTFGAAPTLFTSDSVPLPTVSPDNHMLKLNKDNMTYERRTSLRSNSSHCTSVMPWALSAKSLHANELASFSFNSLFDASANSIYNGLEFNDGSHVYTEREAYHMRSSFDGNGANNLTRNHSKNYDLLDGNNDVERDSNVRYGHARRRSKTSVWDTKCKKEQLPSLSFAQFWHSMVVLADNWTCGVGSKRTVMEYVVFLMELYAEVFAHDWNADDDALLEEIRQSDEREWHVHDSTEVQLMSLTRNSEQLSESDIKRNLTNTKEEILTLFAKMAEELAEYTSSDSDDFLSFNTSGECNSNISDDDNDNDNDKYSRSRRREVKRQHSLKRREWLGETLFSSSDLEHSLLSGTASPTKLNSRLDNRHQQRKSVESQKDNANVDSAKYRHKHKHHHRRRRRTGSVSSFNSLTDSSSALGSSCETSFISSSAKMGEGEGEGEQWKLFQSLCAHSVDEDGWEYFDRVNSSGELAHFRRKVILINKDGQVVLPTSTSHRWSMSSSTMEYINAASLAHRRRSSSWEESSNEVIIGKERRRQSSTGAELHHRKHEDKNTKRRHSKKMSSSSSSTSSSSTYSISSSSSAASVNEKSQKHIHEIKYSNYTIHLIEQELDDDGNVINTRNLHIKRRLTQEEKEQRESEWRLWQTEQKEGKITSLEEESQEQPTWDMHLRTSASEDEMLYWTESEPEMDIRSEHNKNVHEKNYSDENNREFYSDANNARLGATGSTCVRHRFQFDALPTQLRRLENRVVKDDYDENDNLSESASWSSFSFTSFWDDHTETDMGEFALESSNKDKKFQQNTRKRQRVRRHGLRNEMRRYYREPSAYYNTTRSKLNNNSDNTNDTFAKATKLKTRNAASYDPWMESIAEGYEDYSVSECDSVDILSKEREARELEAEEREETTRAGGRRSSKKNNEKEQQELEELNKDSDKSNEANKGVSSTKYEGLEPLTQEEKTELMNKKKWLQEMMERKGIPLTDAMFDDEAKHALLFRLLHKVEEKERVKSSQTNNKNSSMLGKLAKNKNKNQNGSNGEFDDDEEEEELGIAGFDAQLLSKLFQNTEFSLEDLQRSELMRRLLGDSLSGSSTELTPAQVNRIFAALEHYKVDDASGTKSTMLTGSERRKREKLLEEAIKKEQQRLIENAKRRQERLAALKDNIEKPFDAGHDKMSNMTSAASTEINLEKQSMLNSLDKKRRNNALRSLLHNKKDKNDGLAGITGTMYHINTIQRGNLPNKVGDSAIDSTFITNYGSASIPSLPALTTLNKENSSDKINSFLPLDSATTQERIRQEELYLEFEKYCREQEQSKDLKYKLDDDASNKIKFTEEQLEAFFSHLHLGAKDKALLRGRAPLAGTTSLLGGGAFHQEMQRNPAWKNNASHRLRFELGSCQAQWVHKPTHTNMQSSHLPHHKAMSDDKDANLTNDDTQIDYFVPAPVKLFTLTTKDNINNAIEESYWNYVSDRDYHRTLLPKIIKPEGKNGVQEYLQEVRLEERVEKQRIGNYF